MDHLSAGKHLITTLQQAGHTAYFAGGWVRDFLMGHPSDDIDIATSASTDELLSLFPKTIPVGINFGIIIVVIKEHSFEVATFRKDRGYVDGRRPIGIDPAPPEEDAKRRDFTINGMFYDPLTETLYDYVEGQKDLEKKLIRAIGNPHERFLEDRLRMIRAIRYASRFHFHIERETLDALHIHAPTLFPSVAIERVVHELEKMNRFPNFDKALLQLHEHHLLPLIFPYLKKISLQEVKARLHFMHQLPAKTPLILKLLELFPSGTLQEHLNLATDLKLSNQDKNRILFLHQVKETPFEADDYTWAHLYAHPLFQEILLLQTPSLHHERMKKLEKAIERIRLKKFLVTSQMLIDRGMKPGAALGKKREEIERYAINHHLNTAEEALPFIDF